MFFFMLKVTDSNKINISLTESTWCAKGITFRSYEGKILMRQGINWKEITLNEYRKIMES